MVQVNLIVGGVQKGGTTTLYKHLQGHAGIAFGDTKELHVASDKDRFADPDYDLRPAYDALFTKLDEVGRSARYFADATPVYCYWPNAVERLADYNPNLKLILIYRDPIERALSHWKMEYAKKNDTMSFPQAIRSGRSRVMSDPSAPGFHRVYSYVERGFYAQQLRRVYASFPRDQVLVLENRMLSHDLDGTLARIWRFLDLAPPASAAAPIRENIAFEHDYGYEFDRRDGEFLYRLFRWDIEAFGELSGLDVSHWGNAYKERGPLVFADVLRERDNASPVFDMAFTASSAVGSQVHPGLHEPQATFEPINPLAAELEKLRSENRALRAQIAAMDEPPPASPPSGLVGKLRRRLGAG